MKRRGWASTVCRMDLVCENIHRSDMSITRSECQASKVANSDTCPRPTAGGLAVAGLLAARRCNLATLGLSDNHLPPEVGLGFARIVALYSHSSTSYEIR
jgi:hypothetical protein